MKSNAKRWVLVGLEGPVKDREYHLLDQKILLGRTDECDIEIDHASVSRQHAEIVIENETVRISDLGSKNGVAVNGKKGASFELKSGDKIILGACRFKFVSEKVEDSGEVTTSPNVRTQIAEAPPRPPLKEQIRLVLSKLKTLDRRRTMLWGTAVLFLLLLLIWWPKRTETPAPTVAPSPPPRVASLPVDSLPQTVSDEEYGILRRQAESALLYNDAKQAHTVLAKMNLYNPQDLWVKGNLARTSLELQRLIDIYYESGAREYERKNYYRAISEWRKCMALAKGYDENKYEEAKKKVEEARAEALETK